MIVGIAIFCSCLAAVFAIIAVHECGHFLAGVAGGIPRARMKVRLFDFPQHVALLNEGRWLHPLKDSEHYIAASISHLKSHTRAGLYISGGLLLQTLAFVIFAFVLAISGMPGIWTIPVVGVLVSVPYFYLGADLLFTRVARRPRGDYSFLWAISPLASVALTALVLGVHTGVLVYLIKHG